MLDVKDQERLLVAYTYKLILINELSNRKELAYKFSDADGVKGRSGYSFGVSQFDIKFNDLGPKILKEIGFNANEITALIKQTKKITPEDNAKLLKNSEIIDKYDLEHMKEVIVKAINIYDKNKIDIDGQRLSAILALVDYINQYGMPKTDGSFVGMLKANNGTGNKYYELIYKFKRYKTAYGKLNPKDVDRRHNGLLDILALAEKAHHVF